MSSNCLLYKQNLCTVLSKYSYTFNIVYLSQYHLASANYNITFLTTGIEAEWDILKWESMKSQDIHLKKTFHSVHELFKKTLITVNILSLLP